MFRLYLSCLGFITTCFLIAEPVLAGPGGRIARTVANSFWARLVIVLLVMIFLPVILWVSYKEKRAEKRTRQDLAFLGQNSPLFDWLTIQQRAKDCFLRVHSAWAEEDLSTVSEWMTSWYWQNQQQVALNKWKKNEQKNVCDVKKIERLRPLLLVHRNDGKPHEGSRIMIAIRANMQDYLTDRHGCVIEGDREYKSVTTVWSFILHDGAWKVADIEESHTALSYANMLSELPPVESTVMET